MKALVIGFLFTLTAIAADEQFAERVVQMTDGQAVKIMLKKSTKLVVSEPALCQEEITVRVENGFALTTPNPFFEECSKSQNLEFKRHAQERGGEPL